MDERNRMDISVSQNTETANELNRKQVFIDLETKSTERPNPVESYTELPELRFDKKAVLDEAFAERKEQREKSITARQQPISARRDLNTSLPKPHRRPAAKPRRARSVRFTDVRLCSGELSSDALRRIARQFGALLLFCALVAVIFSLKSAILDWMTDDDYSSLARSTTYSAPVTSGGIVWTDSTLPDGFAAAQAVCTKLDTPITDRTVFEKAQDKLLNPSDIAAGMETALTADQVQLKTNMSNLDLLLQIYMSLDSGNPVIVLFSDKESNALRYAVVTHMDADSDKITVQISDGSTKIYTLEQFIAATRLENTESLPFQVRAGLTFGSWSRNTAIFVE